MQHSDAPGGVVCEFVRQRCTHDALFQPFYKRSNRTKGSKILRCFPHCCPNHAHRGFCGSSLHVRVEWPSAGARSAPPPSIHVLGRFRLSDAPPLPLGQCLPAPAVFGAVQSDDTPNGEWIDSQMIYSWSETNWLFEINSAARWFYGWESSTVKSQRLKDHVLDIYVLAATSADVLRVVASTTSPSFQLISFRRATDDAMLALSATHHVRQQLQGGANDADLRPQQHPPQEEDKPRVLPMGGPHPPQVRYHADSHAPPPPMVRPLHHLHAPPATSTVPVTRPLSLPSLRPPSLSVAATTGRPTGQWTAPPLAAPVTTTSRPLTALAPLHRALPPTSLRSYAPPPSQGPTQAPPPQTRPLLLRPAAFAAPPTQPQPAWRPPQLAIARPVAPAARSAASSSSSTALGGRESAAWEVSNLVSLLHQVPLNDAFERVAWVHAAYAQHTAEYAANAAEDADKENVKSQGEPRDTHSPLSVDADAEMSVRRALASLGLHASPRKLPPQLLTTLTELALWLLFDQVTIRQLQGAALNATEALTDSERVLRYYRRAVFFLHDHIGRFLERRFQTTIRDVLRECELLGLQLQRESSAEPATAPRGAPVMKGQDAFVAQAREVLIATQKPTKRRRLAPAAPLIETKPSALSGRWACSLDDVVVMAASAAKPDASLFSLLWFYRQFSVLTLELAPSAKTLHARSLFALASPLRSTLVLDGVDRFFHAFPAGEATLATDVGRYAFGDYVGELVDASLVRLRLYAFLAPSQLPPGDDLPLERVAADACVCYHVTLRLDDASKAPLAAAVAVETGALDVAALRRAGYGGARALLRDMATWSLRQKLAAVRGLAPAARAELRYRPC